MRKISVVVGAFLVVAYTVMATPVLEDVFWGATSLKYSFVFDVSDREIISKVENAYKQMSGGVLKKVSQQCDLPCFIGRGEVHELIYVSQRSSYVAIWVEYYRVDEFNRDAPEMSYPTIVPIENLDEYSIIGALRASEQFRYFRRAM